MKVRELLRFKTRDGFFDHKIEDFHVRDSRVKEGSNANKRLIALFNTCGQVY